MSSTLKEDVKRVFGERTGSDDKILEECTSICQIYNLSAENLLYKWEALNFRPSSTRSEISDLTMDSIVALKAQIQRDIAKENAKRPQHRMLTTSNTAMVNRSRLPGNILKSTPAVQKPITQVKVEEDFGVPGPSTSSSITFKGPSKDASSLKDRSYRYMYEKILERSEALDDRIEEFSELIRERYNVAELGDPSSSTDKDITVIGRIVHDSDTSDGKLTENSVALEVSRANGGSRINLRFDPALTIRGGARGAGSLGLFPGAIAALRGKNGGGGWFLVKEILSIPPPKSAPPSVKPDPGVLDTPFSMFIACGPYTQDSDLSYKHWRALLKALKANKPSVVLLMGPFIDVQHPKIKNGDTDMLPAHLFRSLFIEPLKNVLESSPGSIAILIPSTRDVVSKHAVYPQGYKAPPVVISSLTIFQRIHFLPNPSPFSVNDITFGATSVDLVYHVRKEELLLRGAEADSIPPSYPEDTGTDTMGNACQLQQEINLSVTHLDGLRLGDENNNAPDVLIFPSRLKHFTKIVHSTTMINPSFLNKGTYAKMDVAAKSVGRPR
ncbi:hypothetical protein H0H92_002544 [Tricholoma furcatifolium]|nr:hypothetical protein H0H92_002544 [Tricholoma furcatifolium]